MGIEQDIADIQDVISQLTAIILDGQVEMHALEAVLIERHGLSPDALREHREQAKLRQESLRAALESATRKIERFREPRQ